MGLRRLVRLYAFLAVVLPLCSAHGVEYTFTRVWTVPAPVYSFPTFPDIGSPPVLIEPGGGAGLPAINDSGMVTFWGFPKGGDASLYLWNGGVPVSIVDTKGEFGQIDHRPSINNSGTVAFSATLSNTGSRGIFTWNNGVIDTVYDDTGKFSYSTSPRWLFTPDINNSGTLVFRAKLDAGGEGVFTGNGGPTTTIADTGSFDSFRGKPAINDGNVVAFVAERAGDDTGVFLGSGGPLTTVADDSTQVRNVASEVALNNGNVVAFEGVRADTGESGIYTYQSGIVNKIMDHNGPFVGSADPAINDRGLVAFAANLDSGGEGFFGEGIFIGPDPVRDKVIEVGDTLDGFTVQSVLFGPNGGNHRINNAGQIVFTTRLMAGGGKEYWSIIVASPVPPFATRQDFNADEMSDILWRSELDGSNALWQMNGFTPQESSFLPSVPVSWAVAGVCDFDGDQMADILWRDNTGQDAIWLMNGATPRLARLIPAVALSWSVAGVGDFNADDHCDILWRNADGSNAQWFMNGVTPVATRLIDPVSTTWSVEAVDDFNGDNYMDILWRDNVGQNAIWLMKGFSTLQASLIPSVLTDWAVAGTGDFDGDANSDILWRDVTGRNALWLMDGVSQKAARLLPPVSVDWSIVATGDYNGDAKIDVLWRHDSGQNAVWLMDGFNTEATQLIPPLLDTSWEVQ